MPRLLAAALWAASVVALPAHPIIESGFYSNHSSPATNGTYGFPYGTDSPRIPYGTGSVTASPTATTTSTMYASMASGTAVFESTAAPMKTLLPAVHWDHQKSNVDNLRPVEANSGVPLYYDQHGSGGRADPGKEAMMAFMTPYFKTPSVVLDHSDFVKSVSYQQGALSIVFTNPAAYARASSSWNVDNGLLMVTYTEGCGGYWDGERCYFQVDEVIFNPKTGSALAKGIPASLNDVIDKIDLEWGTWKPSPTTVSGPRPTSTGTDLSFSGSGDDDGTCYAPVDTKYGLPTACLGDYFDEDLDVDLGYKALESYPFADLVLEAVPELDEDEIVADSDEEYEDIEFLTDAELAELFPEAKSKRNTLSPRFVPEIIKKAGNTLANGAKATWNAASNAGSAAVNGVKNLPAATVNIVKGEVEKIRTNPLGYGANLAKLHPAGYLLNKPNDSKVKVAQSPWGEQLLLKSFVTKSAKDKGGVKKSSQLSGHLDLYCVDCGIQGSVTMKGKVTASLLDGITDGTVTFDADIKAGLKIGIDAAIKYKFKPETATLFKVALPGFQIPGGVAVGPILTLGANFEFEAIASGTILAGAEYRIAKATYTYNFKDKSNFQAGWTPSFTPIFEAEGELEVSAKVGLPIDLALGMHVLGGSCRFCKWDVHIKNTPSLKAAAQVAAKIGLNEDGKLEGGLESSNGCKGISTSLKWKNELSAGFRAGPLEREVSIHDTGYQNITQGCIPLKKSKTASKRAEIGAPWHHGLMVRQDNTTVPANETIIDVTEDVITDLEFIGYHDPNVTASPYNDTNGYEFTTIMDYSRQFALASCTDGNVYIHSLADQYNEDIDIHCGDLWAHTSSVAVMDGSYHILHYYNNTMSVTGVSRLRVSDEEEIPSSSVYVALVPFDIDEDPTTPDVYVALDANFNMFFPVECAYANSSLPSKVFLVQDPAAGMEMLKSEDVMYSITGGKVSECYFLAMVQGSHEEGLWESELEVENEEDWELEYNFDDEL
ncbi:hypothetical protein H2199_000966 [Coniosporium tulheliwenetii]|uniref:Uncharacterized protein n=1 Tax=Coniosporium tulheliwenetii TaxID=3383036 RepID=A0ACC2ZNT2_9PEZI|nr:hypothetical protein H2199_000966 [Cladosporium sp. JES 115]